MERIYRMLYPMRACLITSRHEGKDNVMSATWVFPVSMDPPLFGVSLSPKRHSFGMVRNGKAFGINIPSSEMEAAVRLCGSKSGRDCDKFAEAKLTKEEGIRVPLIAECPSSIECELVDSLEMGDHTVFVGKAVKTVRRKEGKGIYQSADGFVPV
jgi:flavin reductase (DIM6/NTAB) family NADH-FMN oxidoreductase RutF